MTTPDNHALSRFCYRVGIHTVLLETDVQSEIVTGRTVCPVPFAPAWCRGLISLRGNLYPVIDMHWVLERRTSPTQTQLLLLQHHRFSPAVLTCDGYPRPLKLPTALPMENNANLPSWITHTLQYAGQTLLAADHGTLFRQVQRLQGN
ncbi:MAG: chemotaxis protein CheW [Thiothrix sp.]